MSFFSRLYLSIAATVVFSVWVAVTIAEELIYYDEIKQFSREAQMVASHIEQKLNELEYVNPATKHLSLPYPFDIEFSAQLVEQNAGICNDCRFLTSLGLVNIYQRSKEDAKYTVLPIKDSRYLLAVYEKLDSERTKQQMDEFDDDVNPESVILTTLLILLAIFLALTIYWPVKQLQQQIHKLIASQRYFGQGNLNIRADENIQRPINLLAQSFNQMAQDISDNVKERDIFAQAIPHEVRTPLSRIQLASGLARKKSDSQDVHSLLDDIDNYVGDINQLISQIVEFSRIAANKENHKDEEQTVNVEKFIRSRVTLFSQGIDTNIQCLTTVTSQLTTNPVYLRLLIDNFIKNAINYAKSRVVIRIGAQSNQLVISVEDDGPGIPEQDRENIFIPFARLDKSRTRATGGLGLGLAIAKAASDKMNGDITVDDANLGGAKFTFTCYTSAHKE